MRGRYAVRLGPEDVGRRVTVRRRLGPDEGVEGGPTTTDVVGLLRAWSDDVLEVERDDGTVVPIPEAAVVAARARPPRAPSAEPR